mmetsp:Transcript_44235/g.117994  ORF Transcript_44235/g.117994 Transcript_44235/m.117994 type:complete len:238 (+) Transcript_44235:276-989(+)
MACGALGGRPRYPRADHCWRPPCRHPHPLARHPEADCRQLLPRCHLPHHPLWRRALHGQLHDHDRRIPHGASLGQGDPVQPVVGSRLQLRRVRVLHLLLHGALRVLPQGAVEELRRQHRRHQGQPRLPRRVPAVHPRQRSCVHRRGARRSLARHVRQDACPVVPHHDLRRRRLRARHRQHGLHSRRVLLRRRLPGRLRPLARDQPPHRHHRQRDWRRAVCWRHALVPLQLDIILRPG